MTFSAEIFIPDEKPKPLYTNYYVNLAALLGFFSLYVLKDAHNDLIAIMLCLIAGICGAFYFIMSFGGMFRYMPLNGTINGNIIISDDFIQVDDKTYKVSEIKDFKIEFNDSRGGPIMRTKLDNRPGKSAGTNNFISFNFNNDEIRVQIRLLSIDHKKDIAPVIKQFIIKNIISCKDGISMLKANMAANIWQIRDLKKELNCQDVEPDILESIEKILS